MLNGSKLRPLIKDSLLTMILCAPNKKQEKGNLGQKGLSDNTKVDFGVTNDHGQEWVGLYALFEATAERSFIV